MSVEIHSTGAAAAAVASVVPRLIADEVASGITMLDDALWGDAAQPEAAKRLAWTEAVVVSRELVPAIVALREKLAAAGVDHVVLCGMGGSSLAPEVITRTMGVELTVLDSTDPGQVRAAVEDRLATTAVVVSSKSGSTLETDSQRRSYEQAFRAAGIDPAERIVVVTDPGSALEAAANEAGYVVFTADPGVGGRYSALTAFGLVPSGLAGVDVAELLDEAESEMAILSVDLPENPGLILGAALAGTSPLKDKIAIVADGTHIVGFGDWVEQLIAESTGKDGKGLLPVVLEPSAPELTEVPADLQIIRLVADASDADVRDGEIAVSGTLGALLLTWEYAVAVAGRLLGINPFDQPDVEAAKVAARGLLEQQPAAVAPLFADGAVEVRSLGLDLPDRTVGEAVAALLAALPDDGYVSIQAYVDRTAAPGLVGLRDVLAELCGRPVTFGWGPRFLHSTGQYHKGGPAFGVFLQITSRPMTDLEIPDRPFTYGQLIAAQASGDASVLSELGRPVLTLTLTDLQSGVAELLQTLTPAR